MTLVIEQIFNPLIIILIIVSLLNLLMGRITDFDVILAIVIINTIIGCYQEYKSRIAVSSLGEGAPEYIKVIRDKDLREVSTNEIVPGDIVVLFAGDKIPADGHLFDICDLRVDEALLTGESLPVAKNDQSIHGNVVLAEQKNYGFAGTLITSGNAKMIVTATGYKTKFGQIAKSLIEENPPETILERQIKIFTIWIIKIVSFITSIIFFLSIIRHYSFLDSISLATALAVSAIPEGLPALITITLAIGVYNISKRNAIIQDLDAVETLGQINVIATDKTGTLTKNELTLTHAIINEHIYHFTGIGYNPKGTISCENNIVMQNDELKSFIQNGILCNDSALIYETKNSEGWKIIGDPTEGALIVAGEKIGLKHEAIKQQFKKFDEIPFSTKNKYMATLHKTNNDNILIVKGAPEIILSLCSKFPGTSKKKIIEYFENYAKRGYRVLGLATKKVSNSKNKILSSDLKNLEFNGLFLMEDTPRSNVTESIKIAYSAGIRVIMITGDNALTASAIAQQIGLKNADNVISGELLEKIDDRELNTVLDQCNIFARISPMQKLRLVKFLEKKKKIVAVTGDGINDAPSIKSANVGIAMGKKGTAISREAAAMVLTDDRFMTIIAAIEEGRIVYQNIKRILFYLLSTNIGEVLVVGTALILGMALPVSAIQILWINLFTDTFNTFPLLYEPAHNGLMQRPPRESGHTILDKPLIVRMLLVAITMAIIILPLFAYYSKTDLSNAQSFAFAVLTISQLFNVFNSQNLNTSLIKLKWIANPWPMLTVIITMVLTYTTVENPILQKIFKTTGLTSSQWLIVFLLSFSVILVVELHKYFRSDKTKI